MRQFGELIKERSFESIRSRELPTLQNRVYNALRNLSASELDFMLMHDYPKLSINNTRIDLDTHYIICSVLQTLLDTPKLLLTNDDLLCAWQRFKELIFLKQAVNQGILVEKPDAEGGVTYWCEKLPLKPILRVADKDVTLITIKRFNPTIRVLGYSQ